MKPNVIFVHILKCGGTSLRHMLLNEYGYDAIAPVPIANPNARQAYPYIPGEHPLEYMEKVTPELVKDYQLVMSHYDIRVASKLPEWHIITVLRHPVTQLHSLWKFTNRDKHYHVLPQDQQIKLFRQWLNSEDGQRLFNVQTNYLSSHGDSNKFTAISWLMNGRLTFGILERFDETLQLFNESFGWSLTPQHLNKTPKALPLDEETVKLVEEIQVDDMELYRIACELFDTQFKEEPA